MSKSEDLNFPYRVKYESGRNGQADTLGFFAAFRQRGDAVSHARYCAGSAEGDGGKYVVMNVATDLLEYEIEC